MLIRPDVPEVCVISEPIGFTLIGPGDAYLGYWMSFPEADQAARCWAALLHFGPALVCLPGLGPERRN